LATIPLIAALLGTLGIMALTSIPLNYVNFVVLPIMIGICINDGVLIISYWLQEPESNLTEILGKIGRAVLLTSLTTLMGFGSLVCSHYPGLRSIGLLTGLGILVELSASLLFLPALLGWMEQQATSKKVLR
jgi:predicted RND superfamily exporter protein